MVYDGKWKIYSDWCESIGFSALNMSGPQLAEFFEYLFRVKGLACSTLSGYKASVLQLSVISLVGKLHSTVETIFARLFKAFASERPAAFAALCNWNLSIVLWGFKKAPFERLDDGLC